MQNRSLHYSVCLSLTFLLLSEQAFAGPETLPQGVGIYQFGYRNYSEQTEAYTSSGDKRPIGDRFNKDFSGQNLSNGVGGADLKRLGDELNRYEASNPGRPSLADELNLGSLRGDVTANVNAKIFGLGYGVNDQLTLFLGVPYIQASVDTSISFSGENNAQLIKQKLGGLAYSELQSGLDQASRLSTAQVKDGIENVMGYQSIDHWEHSGVGDVRIGAQTGKMIPLGSKVSYGLGLMGWWEMPTGYVEQPDILTDVNLGRGYHALNALSNHQLKFGKFFFTGVEVGGGIGIPTTAEKRLPAGNEELVAKDRTTSVDMQPGPDGMLGSFMGVDSDWFLTSYKYGYTRHVADTYSGSMEGNYSALNKGSDRAIGYHEVNVQFKTIKAYERKSFAVPFILSFTAHQPSFGKNATDERYYEISLSSFFSTPRARKEPKTNDKQLAESRKKERSKNSQLSH